MQRSSLNRLFICVNPKELLLLVHIFYSQDTKVTLIQVVSGFLTRFVSLALQLEALFILLDSNIEVTSHKFHNLYFIPKFFLLSQFFPKYAFFNISILPSLFFLLLLMQDLPEGDTLFQTKRTPNIQNEEMN